MLQLLLSLLGRCFAVAVVYTRRADFTDGQFHSWADFTVGQISASGTGEHISASSRFHSRGDFSIWQISQLVGFQHRADFTVGRISASGGFYSRADFSIGQISQLGGFQHRADVTVGQISFWADFISGRFHFGQITLGRISASGGFGVPVTFGVVLRAFWLTLNAQAGCSSAEQAGKAKSPLGAFYDCLVQRPAKTFAIQSALSGARVGTLVVLC